MKIAREELLRVLKRVSPAVADKDLIEELTCVWFDGETIQAYNDLISIKLPFKSDIKGGFRHKLLVGFLSNSAAKEVTVESKDKKDVVFKAGESKLKLKLLSLDQMLFKFPNFPNMQSEVDKDFVQVISKMLVSVGADTSIPDQLGVTFYPFEDELDLFSTDSNTLSTDTVKRPDNWPDDRLVVPTLFCEQVLDFCKAGGVIAFDQKKVFAKNKEDEVIFGRVVEVDRPTNFDKILKEYRPKDYNKYLKEIPRVSFDSAIARCMVVLNGRDGDPIRMTFDGKGLNLYSKSDFGEADAVVDIKDHDEVVNFINPILIQRALPYCNKLLLTKKCLIMKGEGDFTHLVSAMTEK